ncbi:E3 ubiquitin-protein ligase TRIM21-like [Thunnus thynnus]|uniref:E3 ubiquitin-protein ligase TRIM21-like n=1 Tax=Thunnus thynnus TaxID=8237 RepID=UPI0035289B21
MKTKEDLLNTLEDLKDEEFKKFKWFLEQPDILEDHQAIKASRLEKAERRDTVDLMVQTYQLPGAAKVTKKLLKKINRNDLLQSLSGSSSGPEDHKTHEFVPLKEEYEGKKAEAEIQQMIQKRRLKIQQIKHSVDLSKEAADREIAEGVQVFIALRESVERSLNELIETIEEKQTTTEKQAEDFIKELKQEISELMKRSSEVKQLSRSEDHLHLLQNFPSLKAAPPTKDWTKVSVRPSYEGTVTQLGKLSKEMKKLLAQAELKRVQQYAVDVTLDPDTANSWLILSDDGKQVNYGDVWKNLPDNPERFRCYADVLGKQRFSSGRFYFEVQVKGKTEWDLGVARESINRKGKITLRPQDGYWTIVLKNGNEYSACNDPPVILSLKSQPQKVGVFVDYEEGLVSFYDVDAAAHIYSFTGCSFTEKLYPFFSPCSNDGGKNSAPLIICPVNQTA